MACPLTKRKANGDLYSRPLQVERQIDGVLSQDPSTIRRHLTVADPQASDYLSSECLVHLARYYRRHDDDSMANKVLSVLLSRCEKTLLAKIPDNELPTAREVQEEVIGQFGELFATDGTQENRDDLDYFECRFNGAFRTFYIDIVRSETASLKRLAPLPDQADDTHKELQSPETADSALLCRELREAIDALPDDERKAVILYYKGYKIESKNPNEVTVATICNVSGRTIRNRLSRAAEKLSAFKAQ